MNSVAYLTSIKCDFSLLLRHDNEVLFGDIEETQKCLQKVKQSADYADLSDIAKVRIDDLRFAIRTELTNEERKLGLLNAAFVGSQVAWGKVKAIPLYLLPGFIKCVSEHRAGIPVPEGYDDALRTRCLGRKRELQKKFDREWKAARKSEESSTASSSNPGVQYTPLLIAFSLISTKDHPPRSSPPSLPSTKLGSSAERIELHQTSNPSETPRNSADTRTQDDLLNHSPRRDNTPLQPSNALEHKSSNDGPQPATGPNNTAVPPKRRRENNGISGTVSKLRQLGPGDGEEVQGQRSPLFSESQGYCQQQETQYGGAQLGGVQLGGAQLGGAQQPRASQLQRARKGPQARNAAATQREGGNGGPHPSGQSQTQQSGREGPGILRRAQGFQERLLAAKVPGQSQSIHLPSVYLLTSIPLPDYPQPAPGLQNVGQTYATSFQLEFDPSQRTYAPNHHNQYSKAPTSSMQMLG
jgi:hypothetical protein